MSEDRDIVHHFAEFAANVCYDDLTPEARETAKKSILDTLGVILAASGLEPAVQAAIEIVDETGGTGQCTILAYGKRGPALMAAFAHGSLAHCLDYDDQTPWGQHAASSIVPAVFAVAERQGGVSGKDLIAAVAAGQDIFARLRCNVGWLKDWNLSTVFGVYAGTAAAGRVMGLSATQLGHALGIASMQSAGVQEMVCGTGSDLRGLYAGFSAKGAVLAAMMAEKGLSGIDRLFEGDNGVFKSYFGGRYDRAAILKGLGSEFLGAGTLYKRWPSVGTAHSHMKATIDIVVEQDLAPENIAEIRLAVGDYHAVMCEPLEVRQAPGTLVDAKFSLPYLVAVAAVRRGMTVADFSAGNLQDPVVLGISRKTVPIPDSSLDWKLELPPGRVEIITADGRSFEKVGLGVPGGADNPMEWDDVANKFRECASVAVLPVLESNVEKAVKLASRLEQMEDATELLRILVS